MPADGSLSDAKLVGRAGNALVTGGRFESAKRIQGG
jgi:hypothetical protein